MAITAAMVKELREKSGAGMMDCKKALTACEGNMEKAIDFLRENGKMKAAKKADRIAAEGLCKTLVSADGKKAVAVEVNSETDFVAKNEKFQAFVQAIAEQIMATDAADVDALLATTLEDGKTVAEFVTEHVATIGENLKVRRFARVAADNGFITSYTHMGGKIVVLVEVEADECTPESLCRLLLCVRSTAHAQKFLLSILRKRRKSFSQLPRTKSRTHRTRLSTVLSTAVSIRSSPKSSLWIRSMSRQKTASSPCRSMLTA